ncbi:MAG: MalY/PatB family protein [Eubacteriales bacterium]
MKYNFDEIIDRRASNSLKWDVRENELPMWVADMDFRVAPEIEDAILRRAGHGIFGYSVIPEEWYDAYVRWWQTRHGFMLDRDWLIFCTGVIPAVSSVVRKLTTPAEKVVLQTPVYGTFFNSILNNGRQALESPLLFDGGDYSIDFADLEAKLADPQTSLMILCNPHNPIGKIWDRETLARIGELCKKHHVLVLSDEIHCDLCAPGREYVPFASVSDTCRENSITCLAPTKTFNLAGIHTAAVSVPDPVLRHKVWRALNTDEVAEPNAFSVPAAVAAFTEGAPWLDAAREYIFENKHIAADFLKREQLPIRSLRSEATYLMWLDCSALCKDAAEFAHFLRRETGLFVSEGSHFGTGGQAFLRVNAACPRSLLMDGLQRLKCGAAAWSESQHA